MLRLRFSQAEIADRATQMGACNKLDLTSDVTHLVVGDVDTPKYKYVAKERPDVKVMRPEWVDAVRDIWMEGGEIDLKELLERYKLPTFYGLRICLTGLEERTFSPDLI
jgi:DNA replication regulator DPB11